ncbi:MAG: retropepsin-like aspartic protease family protein [Paracoccaceae bacterium]
MSGDQIASVLFLGLLGAWIAAGFFRRGPGPDGEARGGTALRQAGIWVLIFGGVIFAAGIWGDISGDMDLRATRIGNDGSVALPLRRDGHYHATLEVNGEPIHFLVDTGATAVVLSPRDAERIGFAPENLRYIGQARTANGVVRTAPVTLDTVTLGPLTDRDVPALVNEAEMDRSLLGMTYLNRFDTIAIGDGEMRLSR